MNFKLIFLLGFLLNYSVSAGLEADESNTAGIIPDLQKAGISTKNIESTEQPKKTTPIFDIRFDKLPTKCLRKDLPINCAEATDCTEQSGIYQMRIPKMGNGTFLAYCDDKTDDGDWLVIQLRKDGSENFNRSWTDYKYGFGQPQGEYWLGLDIIYALTNFNGPQELYVHLEDFDGVTYYAKYDNFQISNETEYYKLNTLGLYTGTATDSFSNTHIGRPFVTYDRGDIYGCGKERWGGWWFQNCGYCFLNGKYFYTGTYTDFRSGIYWFYLRGYQYSFKSAKMMIRRRRI